MDLLSRTEFAELLPENVELSGLLSVYPSLALQPLTPSLTGTPISYICGLMDDYTKPAHVLHWYGRIMAQNPNYPAQFKMIDTAYHGFFPLDESSLSGEIDYNAGAASFKKIIYYRPGIIGRDFSSPLSKFAFSGGESMENYSWSEYANFIQENSELGVHVGGPWEEGTREVISQALGLGR